MAQHVLLSTSILASLALSACGPSTSTVVVQGGPAVAASSSVSVVEVHVDGASRPAASVPAAAAPCPGLTVHPMEGGSRSGRALGMALLHFHARPGAELWVDGVYQGEAPLTAVSVEAGPRDVSLRNPALGYDCTVRLRAVPGERYGFELDLDPPPTI